MPPCDYRHYPKNWKTEIRPRILARAKHMCERCGVRNRVRGFRTDSGIFVEINNETDNASAILRGKKVIKVILTIAHLDHNIFHNEDSNLAALCQRCHLMHDHKQHAETRKRNERIAREKVEPSFPGMEE